MRTLIAVLAGLAFTGLLVFIGDTSFAAVPTRAAGDLSVNAPFVALAWTFIAVALGAIVTTRIRRTNEAISGFIAGELFFGVGLLHQFWQVRTWYSAVAILLVIPAALLGRWIGLQLHFEFRDHSISQPLR